MTTSCGRPVRSGGEWHHAERQRRYRRPCPSTLRALAVRQRVRLIRPLVADRSRTRARPVDCRGWAGQYYLPEGALVEIRPPDLAGIPGFAQNVLAFASL